MLIKTLLIESLLVSIFEMTELIKRIVVMNERKATGIQVTWYPMLIVSTTDVINSLVN
jgi:hypothetical protein